MTARDNGAGISPTDLARLFQPFTQLANAKSSLRGTGLGLALTKQLVELMGGTVDAESTVGVGSRFFFEVKPYKRTSTSD